MKLRVFRRLVATLSITSVVAGVAIMGFAGFHIYQSHQMTGRSLLPSAERIWTKHRMQNINSLTDPVPGSFIGTISIPSVGKSVNIFQGTDNSELAEGVGHFIQSVMPGMADNSVLAGHRDTVFSHLGRVKIGATILITTESGKFTYRVDKIRIVDKNDRTVIVPTTTAQLTLSTCYPFIYIGSAPKRYIVIARLVTRSHIAT